MKQQQLAPEIADGEEQPVPLDAALARLAIVPAEEDVEETMDLVRWFMGRYPTAQERFAYIRRKYAEWTRIPPARLRHP